jgi:hypothetical protein
VDVGWDWTADDDVTTADDGITEEEFDEETFALLLLAGCGAPIYWVGGWFAYAEKKNVIQYRL